MVNFRFKRNTKLLKSATLTFFHYIMNTNIFGTQIYSQSLAYSELWNIRKFDDVYIPVKHIEMTFGEMIFEMFDIILNTPMYLKMLRNF